ATMARYRLPVEPLAALIAARRFDLYDEPMATLADLEAYAAGASSKLLGLAGRGPARGPGPGIRPRRPPPPGRPAPSPPPPPAPASGGVANAIAGLLNACAALAARGKLYVRIDTLDRQGVDRQPLLGGQGPPELRAALAEMRLHARRHLAAARDLLAAVPGAV